MFEANHKFFKKFVDTLIVIDYILISDLESTCTQTYEKGTPGMKNQLKIWRLPGGGGDPPTIGASIAWDLKMDNLTTI